jgi:hypothetical protein
MSKLITKIRRWLGIKDRVIIVSCMTNVSMHEQKTIQRELADEVPDHWKVVVLPPGCNAVFLK